MSVVEAVGRAYTHYLYSLTKAIPGAVHLPWDQPYDVEDESTVIRSWEEGDGTGHIRIDIAADDVHVIGIIGSLAALMNVIYDATHVNVFWTLNHDRLPAVEITILGREIPEDRIDAEARRAIASRL